MATIKEDYVSFEIAKLLKEKGFNEKCSKYRIGHDIIYSSTYKYHARDLIECCNVSGVASNENLGEDAYSVPTLQMAMKWLRAQSDCSQLWILENLRKLKRLTTTRLIQSSLQSMYDVKICKIWKIEL